MDIGIRNANRDIDRELTKNINIVYPAVAYVLWTGYGWRKLRITRFFEVSREVWQECAEAGVEKSMLSMLEDETGIEIKMPGMKSFHEYAYLDADAWDRKAPTRQQILYIRQQQKKWIPAMLLANICLALKRREHWGPDRISALVGSIEELRGMYGMDIKRYAWLLKEHTDFEENEIRRFAVN